MTSATSVISHTVMKTRGRNFEASTSRRHEVADFLPDDRLACLTFSGRVVVVKPHRL